MNTWTEPVDSATNPISALRYLEGIECQDTWEVVVLRVWTGGFVDLASHDAWEVIMHEALNFYCTWGGWSDPGKEEVVVGARRDESGYLKFRGVFMSKGEVQLCEPTSGSGSYSGVVSLHRMRRERKQTGADPTPGPRMAYPSPNSAKDQTSNRLGAQQSLSSTLDR